MTRQLGGLVDVGKLVRQLRAEQLLHEPADLRPPPLALPALETSLVLDALEGRVGLEVFGVLDPACFTVSPLGAIWGFLHGSIEHDVLPAPDDIAEGLAEHLGVDPDDVLAVIRRVVAGPSVFTPTPRKKAETIRDVARLRRTFDEVEALDIELRALTSVRGTINIDEAIARLRAAIRTAWNP